MLVDGEDEYKVEAILDSQMRYNHLEYLVKWKGYNNCKGNLTDLRRELHLSLAKGNPK
jgi:hypothetical protein